MRYVYVSDDNSQHNNLLDAVKQDMIYYAECVKKHTYMKFQFKHTELISAVRNYETFRKMTFREAYENAYMKSRGKTHNQIKRELHKARAEFKLDMQKCIAEYRRLRKILHDDKLMYRISKHKYLEMTGKDVSSKKRSFEHVIISGKIGLVPKDGE